MIRVLAIDDEPLALQQLATYIRKVQFLELVAECRSAIEAIEVLNRETVDAIFCDINMPDLSGMDFVKSLAVTSRIRIGKANGLPYGAAHKEIVLGNVGKKAPVFRRERLFQP